MPGRASPVKRITGSEKIQLNGNGIYLAAGLVGQKRMVVGRSVWRMDVPGRHYIFVSLHFAKCLNLFGRCLIFLYKQWFA